MLPDGYLSSHGCEGPGVSVQTLFNEAGGRKRGLVSPAQIKGKTTGLTSTSISPVSV